MGIGTLPARVLRAIGGLAAVLILAACAEPVSQGGTSRILAMGDSLLAWTRASGGSVSDQVERLLQEPVTDRSVSGAHVIYALPVTGSMGLKISSQYRPGPWEWVILNGGGNDLWLGCGCSRCENRMMRMISDSGRYGSISAEVRRLRGTGARVIYVGYLRSPGFGSMIEHCRNEGDELEVRLARLAARDPGVFFVPVGDMVPHGDRSFHGIDIIHPSAKASLEIARRIVAVIRSADSPHG